MSALAAFLYFAGCLAAMQFADVVKHNPGMTIGHFVYVVAWPIIIPAIWLLAFVDAVRK